MERGLSWIGVAVSVAALAANRDESVFWITLGLLAGGPALVRLAPRLAPSWVVSSLLSLFAYFLPWPVAERMTLIAATPLLLYVSPAGRPAIAAVAMMIVAGQSKLSNTFAFAAALWTALGVAVLWRRQQDLRAHHQALRRRRGWDSVYIALQISLTAGLGYGTMVGLPVFERWLVERTIDTNPPRETGFSNFTNLNSVEEIRNSSAVALRIRTLDPQMMRGQVYGAYRMGVWTSARSGTTPIERPAPETLVTTSVIRVTCAIDGNRIVFAPLEWGALESNLEIFQDVCGVATAREPVRDWAFTVRKPPVTVLTASEREQYLQVPPDIVAPLKALVPASQLPGLSDRQRLSAILFYLASQHEYSLEPGRPEKGEEPILRFLLKTRKGHCEYFAASMALLGRVAGVPSRYVTGYSAVEQNQFGRYLMARDSDAHAWTECWSANEGWTSWDATPPIWHEIGPSKKSWLADLLHELTDYIQERWEVFWDRVVHDVLRPVGAWARQKLRSLTALAVALLVIAFLVRRRRELAKLLSAWLAVLADRMRPPPPDPLPPERRAAVRSLTALEDALSPLGLVRGRAVTPHELSERLSDLALTDEGRAAARELLDLFCRFRYGGAAWEPARAASLLETVRANLTARRPVR